MTAVARVDPPLVAIPERAQVTITQDELATMVTLSRASLVQVLRRFEQRGLIEQGYRTMRVMDEAGLEAVESGA